MYIFSVSRQCTLCKGNVTVARISGTRRRFLADNGKENTDLASGYKPHELKKSHYNENYFGSKSPLSDKPFSLILPPPNITGTLHLGHALTASIQDALIKWHKQHGREVMWVPGLDHAGIATQVVVEKKLWKEHGLARHQLGRERFEKEIWKWKEDKSSTIIEQLKRLNVDLSWEKEVFTMDEKRSKALTEAFIQLFEQGLIYRADHLVNWSCTLQSAVSDIEVDRVSVEKATAFNVPGYEKSVQFGLLTKFAYRISDGGKHEEIVVATTRPETILGDVAVAVNPKDSRYAHLIGKQLHHPFRNDLIPIIADEMVDSDFGTGAVKITPAHDPEDFQTGKRHNLKFLTVIDEQGLLTNCGTFQGLRRFDGREAIIRALMDKSLYRGSQDHTMTIPICSRSKDVIEFLIRPQWFLNCTNMSQKAVAEVREGRLKIEPDNFEKVWFQWLENARDWCISRQLWWGHRVPAYSCNSLNSKEKVWVAAKNADEAKRKASKRLNCSPTEVECVQDEDVLDTWFSSSLQPFSVFGWPDKSTDLDKYYPLSLMETGHDILFFWVARMVMLGTQLTGQLPFTKVLLHGIICDVQGRKMSKSLGNVISPEEVIDGVSLEQLNRVLEQNYRNGILSKEELQKASEGQKRMFPNGIPECGADALRFTLLSHNIKSHVINFDVNECYTNKLFGNKIWQATKFTLLWMDNVSAAQNMFVNSEEELSPIDRWIMSKLTHMLCAVKNAMETHEFHEATAALKQFLYYEYCDVYLEAVKTDLKDRTAEPICTAHCKTLLTCLDQSLRALSPFMPMLAQHLHKHLPKLWNVGLDTSYPEISLARDHQLEQEVDEAIEIITGIRRLKKIFNITFKQSPEVYLLPASESTVGKFYQLIKELSRLQTLVILERSSPKPPTTGLVQDRIGSNLVYLVVPEELHRAFEVDRAKTDKKKEKLLKELEKMKQMVSSSGYEEKASVEAKQNDAKKMAQLAEKISRINYIQSLAGQ